MYGLSCEMLDEHFILTIQTLVHNAPIHLVFSLTLLLSYYLMHARYARGGMLFVQNFSACVCVCLIFVFNLCRHQSLIKFVFDIKFIDLL